MSSSGVSGQLFNKTFKSYLHLILTTETNSFFFQFPSNLEHPRKKCRAI